ncbi:chromate transporter [Cupriavidus sp. YR651]|uniref:chromate transporter n=1 Tax=Cupriavidus sp. YR651 TaxID=1855315 RepID=UPI00088B4D86|nr:chromate transporter [Cupriavidus sp. YR651]SDC15370.1 chromate transporter [Cupriavidus sp. YR651]
MSSTPLPAVSEPELAPPPNARALFFEFARMGLSGFGGVLPFVRRSVVERNRWLNDRDFVEILSLGQVLPGPNVINLALMLGLRFAGLRGAVAAFCGLVLVPMVVVLCAMALYLRYQDVTAVRQMLAGMTAVSAGLVLSTGFKLAQSQPRSVRAIVIGVAAFVLIGLMRWPLLPVMAVLVPVALILEHRASRKEGA